MSLWWIPAVLIVAFVLPIAMARLEPDQNPRHRAALVRRSSRRR